VAEIWQVLSDQGARRNAVLVNVGGGVITDLGGFAASCFKRGIHCVNIPTTLLAQIDVVHIPANFAKNKKEKAKLQY